MNYSIVYSSPTGNTDRLASAIKEVLPQENCLYFGNPQEAPIEAPLVFAGFWTNKGTCDSDIMAFLKKSKNKKVFLFGTAGFGDSPEYYETILKTAKQELDASNTVIGTYMCQGKMPMSIRQRYEKSSLIITTNLPMGRWDELFTGKLAAAAILDRLVHHCHVISITGDSYRVKGPKTEY